jgi:hypothetical protein
LEKIERFTGASVEGGFFKNKVKVAEIIQRLNFAREGEDWLSM